jgi:hypothetical protein
MKSKKAVKKQIKKTVNEIATQPKEPTMDKETKMELWNEKTGTIKKELAIAVACNEDGTPAKGTKFVKLYLSQWVNDKRASRATRIGLGNTGKSMYFAGQNERINRVWGTVPQTLEESKAQGTDSFLNLWNQAEGSTPQTFAIEDKNGTINLVVSSRIDTEEDMQHIIIQLGSTGKAIEISPVQGTVRQTEVSMPFANKPAQKTECYIV